MAFQDGSQKGKINFFDKIAIFNGFGKGLGRVLGGIWEGFGMHLGRSGKILGGLRALWALLGLFCWVLRVFLIILRILTCF